MTVKRDTDIVAAMRAILQARAAGKITATEFERRQAEIHARILDAEERGAGAAASSESPPGGSSATRHGSLPKWLLAIPVTLAVAVAGLYFWLDKGKASSGASLPTASPAAPDRSPGAAQVGEQIKALSAEVMKNPMNGEAWANLARSYAQAGQHAPAAEAYAKAAAILPADASLLADWADSYVVAHDRRWDDTSRDLIRRALATDPRHLKSLSLAATDAFDHADYATAIGYWKRMKEAATGDASTLKYANDNIAEATAAMSGKGAASGDGADRETPLGATANPAAITGTVAIADKLKGRVAPTDTVFVIAKASEGQGPPLAVKRYAVADLPIEFRLDDDASMVPGQGLSRVLDAMVSARVSRSGNPLPQPGDLESTPQRVKVGTRDLRLAIDKVR